jgi:hypothetical protein
MTLADSGCCKTKVKNPKFMEFLIHARSNLYTRRSIALTHV